VAKEEEEEEGNQMRPTAKQMAQSVCWLLPPLERLSRGVPPSVHTLRPVGTTAHARPTAQFSKKKKNSF
jgi:hypothetical protein